MLQLKGWIAKYQ